MRLYLSHAIRGPAGSAASLDVQKANCDKAKHIAKQIRIKYPHLDIYVPAENELFVSIAYRSGHLSEKAILDIDCKIIDGCDGVIAYVPGHDTLQGGRLIEYNHAMFRNIPATTFATLEQIEPWIDHMMYGH